MVIKDAEYIHNSKKFRSKANLTLSVALGGIIFIAACTHLNYISSWGSVLIDGNKYHSAFSEDLSGLQNEISTSASAEFINEEGDTDYILPNSESRYINESEIALFDRATLRLARNEIYARRGRKFETEDLNQYFNSQPWYYGVLSADEFDESAFNEYEKANLDLIKRAENGEQMELPEYITGGPTQIGEADIINSLYTADNGTYMEIGEYSGTGETYVNFSQNGNIIWTGTSNRYQMLTDGGLAILFNGNDFATGEYDSITVEWSTLDKKDFPSVDHDSDTVGISGTYSFDSKLLGN